MTQDPTPTTDDALGPDELAAAEALRAQRPRPRETFRGALARRLSALDSGLGPRPANLWRRVLVLVVIGSLLLVAGVVRADGKAALQHPTITTGPGLTLGFSGAPELTGDESNTSVYSPQQWGQKAVALGATIVRIPVNWSLIAPSPRPAGFDARDPASPGYQWSYLDQQVETLHAEGFRVLLYIETAPVWAQGAKPPSWAQAGGADFGSWEPSPSDFAAFADAIATRYDGSYPNPNINVEDPSAVLPRVSLWQAWNEPNLDTFLSPQWVKSGKGYSAESPTLYRNLLNAFYTAVKSVPGGSSNYVVAAGTAPYGLPPGYYNNDGQARMAPVTFDQHLFCLNTGDHAVACPHPVSFDAIDHHPYGIAGPLGHAPNADDVAVPDIYKLARALDAAERAHTVRPAGKKAIWITEVSWNTTPPTKQDNGVPVAQAARWVEQSFYVLWKQGVSTILWYQIADEGLHCGCYNSGLYYINGDSKPGATAYRFPFLTNRENKSTVNAWGRTPAAGLLKIEVQTGRRWNVVTEFTARNEEVFQLPLKLTGKLTLRAVLGKQTSLNWVQSA